MKRLRTTEDKFRRTGEADHPHLKMLFNVTSTRRPRKPWVCASCRKTFKHPSIQAHTFINWNGETSGVCEFAYCVNCENENFASDGQDTGHVVWDDYNVLLK